MKPFTIITPTGDRPWPFHLCAQYLLRQEVLPAEWIVVDDGETPQTVPPLPAEISVKYIRRVRSSSDPKHTLPAQLLAALPKISTEYVIIMEDDDWYSPAYTKVMMETFLSGKSPWLVGQGETLYYLFPARKYLQNKNKSHASFCQTGFRRELSEKIETACRGCWKNPFLDLAIWRLKVPKTILPGLPALCVGMKGLPGRKGTTTGWNEKHPLYRPDPAFGVLYGYIGNDIELYKSMLTPYQATPARNSGTVGPARGLKNEATGDTDTCLGGGK